VNDKEFLMWLKDRLHFEHGESLSVDYMLKLQAIIEATPEDKFTPNSVASRWMGFEYSQRLRQAPQREREE